MDNKKEIAPVATEAKKKDLARCSGRNFDWEIKAAFTEALVSCLEKYKDSDVSSCISTLGEDFWFKFSVKPGINKKTRFVIDVNICEIKKK